VLLFFTGAQVPNAGSDAIVADRAKIGLFFLNPIFVPEHRWKQRVSQDHTFVVVISNRNIKISKIHRLVCIQHPT
jgi:hypothetical protein